MELLDLDLDVIIYTTEELTDLITVKCNVNVIIKPRVFSNSKYANSWQPEPEFIWLFREDILTKVDDYDIFINLEDDIAFNEKNFKQFVKYSYGENKLDNYIIGNILTETDGAKILLPQFHMRYRGIGKIITINGEEFMEPKNLHQASLIISQEQLKLLIKNKFNSIPKRVNGYNIKCTAMTEPYCTNLLTKIIPLKDLDNSLMEHLSRKYTTLKKRGKYNWVNTCQYLDDIKEQLVVNKENLNGWAISEELYGWLSKNLEQGKTILELGSGAGTIELAKKYKVYSIEHDKKWVGHAKESNYLYAPIIQHPTCRWYSLKELETLKDLSYDLILVDGPPGNIGRIGFLHYINLFNIDVPIIIDDTNRKAEADLAKSIAKKLNKKMELFQGDKKSFIVIK
ncbi:MAG: hypothetical protein PF440_00235 [Thiomicrorhabdus sp.]|nr:hypothetical protein [Thiomicrorhabdus sp.]